MNPLPTAVLFRHAPTRPGRAEDSVRLVRGPVRWTIDGPLIHEFLDSHGLRLEEWQRARCAEIIKSGPHRIVYRLDLASGGYYLKHYRIADWRSVLQNLVRPCRALLEWRAAHTVAKAGIATFDPVGVGHTLRRGFVGDNYLITREIPGAVPLHEFLLERFGRLSSGEQTRFRQRLAAALGELAARLHRRRILHGDFHAGNILVRWDAGRVQLWLIDLHSAEVHPWLTAGQERRNLAQLNNFFVGRAAPADRMRFFAAYCRSRYAFTLSGPGTWRRRWFRSAARRIDAACAHETARTWRRMDRKWAGRNRRYIDVREAGIRIRALTGLDLPGSAWGEAQELALRLACRVENWRATAASPLIRRWSPARRAWEIGHALLRRHIGTPQPLLYCENRSAGSYVLTEELPGAVSLSEFLAARCSSPGDRSAALQLRRLAETLGSELGRLHACGFDHPACSADALLVTEHPGEESPRVWFVSLGKVRSRRFLSHRRRIQNLAVLHASVPAGRTQRVRFLRRYLRNEFKSQWKSLWRDVARSAASSARPLGRLLRAAAFGAILGAGLSNSGCRTAHPNVVAPPARHSVRSDRLLVLSDIKLPKDHPLIQDLIVLREQIVEILDLPPQKEQVVVYMFNTELEYTQFLEATYPGLPKRRAYFVGTPRELAVYTFWGDRIQEDLRHEYTHGILHASLKSVPLWLDEGLAEFFEVIGPEPGQVNRDYAARLSAALANGWRPDLERLERIEKFEQMQRADYQEAWAWVHFLLNGTPDERAALVDYLHELRSEKNPAPLSRRLPQTHPQYAVRFLSYLATLNTVALRS